MDISFDRINVHIPKQLLRIAALLKEDQVSWYDLADAADELHECAVTLACLIDPDTGECGAPLVFPDD